MIAILTISIECVWGMYLKERFYRVVELPADTTLGALHDLIQQLTGFGDDHMATFFTANSHRGRKVWFTEDGETDEDHDAPDGSLWSIPLGRIFPLPKHKKLYYWFDFGDDWIFEIRKKRGKGVPGAGVKYPRVIAEEGPQPEQYPVWDE